MHMEIVCQTEYQDIYRIKSSVLLVVNKFKYVTNSKGLKCYLCSLNRFNSRLYADKCQKYLKILTKPYPFISTSTEREFVPTGTVVYGGFLVEKAEQKDWCYQLKTSGEAFSGNYDEFTALINMIFTGVEDSKSFKVRADDKKVEE